MEPDIMSAEEVLREVRKILGCSEGQSIIDRAKHFEKLSEDNVIPIDQILVAAIKTDKGIGIFTGKVNRAEMEISLTRVNYKIMQMFTQMDMAAMLKAKESEIVLPPESGKIIV